MIFGVNDISMHLKNFTVLGCWLADTSGSLVALVFRQGTWGVNRLLPQRILELVLLVSLDLLLCGAFWRPIFGGALWVGTLRISPQYPLHT